MKTYKKFVMLVLTLAVSLAYVSVAAAASSDAVNVKVTVRATLGVSITEDSLTLGAVDAGSSVVSATGVTVTNSGSGIDETYSISLADPSGWRASQTAAGEETYVLNAGFSSAVSGITWDVTKHALSTSPVACSSTKFAGDQTGVKVPYNAARKLWFQFKAPTMTAVTSEQSIPITITAQAG